MGGIPVGATPTVFSAALLPTVTPDTDVPGVSLLLGGGLHGTFMELRGESRGAEPRVISKTCCRGSSVCDQHDTPTLGMTPHMKSLNGIRLIVISAVVLVVAVASVVVVMMLSTRSTSSTLATMDPNMAGMDMSRSSPAPAPSATMDPNMPGMDMSGSHEHGDVTGATADRPLAPVLGTFGGGTAAVLLSAGMLRRKDRAKSLAKKATRTAGRAKK
jgi:hypothetical protein